MDYFFRHTFDMETRDKKKYVDGLRDLEQHGLIRKIYEKKYNFEYDLQPIHFEPFNATKENEEFFTVVHSDELNTIMQITEKDFPGSKAKLVRYFVNVASTFLHGKKWTFTLPDGTRSDGVISFPSIEILADYSNINKDTVVTYNKILEQAKVLCIYRANEMILFADNTLSGITHTYGRYKYRKFVIGKGTEHKEKYGHDKVTQNIKHKTQKTAERKSLAAKYYQLVSENKMYDEETIIEIYRYAVEYNKDHEGDSFFADKMKDLDFFKQFPFITDDCLKQKPKPKKKNKQSDDDEYIWGEPDPMDKRDYSMEEIFEMETYGDVIKNTG